MGGLFSIAIGVFLGYIFRDKISQMLGKKRNDDVDKDLYR